jgi:uncharacterized membrane-anchored protein
MDWSLLARSTPVWFEANRNFRKVSMQSIHLPTLGLRYWAALCLASIFGANMGDFVARNMGLGHVTGLPFLAAALAVVMVAERFDRTVHQAYYWVAIIIVRTAATNFADFACGDMKQPRIWVIAALTIVLIVVLWMSWQWLWRQRAEKSDGGATVLRADIGYWISMFIAGTLGTVIGDYCSHDLHLGDAGASILLSPLLGVLFLVGRNGALRWLPFYWLTVVMVRAAGTAVGDLVSGRNMLGLPLSTFVTGALFVALLVVWKEQRRTEPVVQVN